MSRATTILITGADGFLGTALAARLVRDTDARLVLWVRAADDAELRAKQAVLRAALGDTSRCAYVGGDLRSDEPFAKVESREITAIVHAAAVTRFDVDREVAEAVNVKGTSRLLEFARRCPLDAFVHLSSVYAAGLRGGVLEEEPWDDSAGFANHYEWSKWAAERLLLERHADLPYRILRIATVVADSDLGNVSRHNAVHKVLRLMHAGLLPIVPGLPSTPLYTVTAELAVDAILAAMRTAERSIVHVSPAVEDTAPLSAWVNGAHDAFGADPDFARRRVLRPLFADASTYEALASSAQMFSSGALRLAMAATAPFAKQLFVHKLLRNDALVALVGARRTEPEALLRGVCASLVASGWREGAMAKS